MALGLNDFDVGKFITRDLPTSKSLRPVQYKQQQHCFICLPSDFHGVDSTRKLVPMTFATLALAGSQKLLTFGQISSKLGQISSKPGQISSALGQISSTVGLQISSTPYQMLSSIAQISSTLGQISSSFGQISSPFGYISSTLGQIIHIWSQVDLILNRLDIIHDLNIFYGNVRSGTICSRTLDIPVCLWPPNILHPFISSGHVATGHLAAGHLAAPKENELK